MKHVLAFVAGGLLLAGTAQAQAGLRAGGTLAYFPAKPAAYLNYVEARNTAKLGYQVGVFYQVPLTKRLALVPEVQFSRERVGTYTRLNNFTIPEYFGNFDTRLSLSYLNVPVLLRATFGPLYVEAGAQGGVLLGGREEGTEYVTRLDTPVSSAEISDALPTDLRRFDVGPCLGVGIKLAAGVGVSVRAYRGLVSLVPDDNLIRPYPYQSTLYRQTLQAALTYQLPARQ